MPGTCTCVLNIALFRNNIYADLSKLAGSYNPWNFLGVSTCRIRFMEHSHLHVWRVYNVMSYVLCLYDTVHIRAYVHVGWIFISELDYDSPVFQFCYWNFCIFGKPIISTIGSSPFPLSSTLSTIASTHLTPPTPLFIQYLCCMYMYLWLWWMFNAEHFWSTKEYFEIWDYLFWHERTPSIQEEKVIISETWMFYFMS